MDRRFESLPKPLLPKPLVDAAYTAVGLGVLGLQQAQVCRRDARRQLRGVAEQIHGRVDPVLDQVESRLTGPPQLFLHQARSTAETLRRLVLG